MIINRQNNIAFGTRFIVNSPEVTKPAKKVFFNELIELSNELGANGDNQTTIILDKLKKKHIFSQIYTASFRAIKNVTPPTQKMGVHSKTIKTTENITFQNFAKSFKVNSLKEAATELLNKLNTICSAE